MWNSLKKMFSKKEEIVEVEKEVEEDPQPEPPPPLPDVIEVPWDVAKYTRNFDLQKDRVYDDLKEMLFQTSVKERAAYDMIEKLQALKEDNIQKIKEAYNIPDDQNYEYETPTVPNRPGYLKKKETK
tara:strand:- start:285 stop:665 length:381 start_codon:yes stop_codon:yes gene_type:complete